MITDWLTEGRIVKVQLSKEAAVILENQTLEITAVFSLERTGTTGH